MIEQKPIQVHDTTFNTFRLVKVKFCAKIEKQLSDNEFILNLLECLINAEKLEV